MRGREKRSSYSLDKYMEPKGIPENMAPDTSKLRGQDFQGADLGQWPELEMGLAEARGLPRAEIIWSWAEEGKYTG